MTTNADLARRTVATLVERAERQIDAVFAPAATDLGDLVAAHGPGPLTHDDRRAILRGVDAVLDRLYGPTRGAASPVASIIVTGALDAYRAPHALEAARVGDLLVDREETALLAAMMRGTREESGR